MVLCLAAENIKPFLTAEIKSTRKLQYKKDHRKSRRDNFEDSQEDYTSDSGDNTQFVKQMAAILKHAGVGHKTHVPEPEKFQMGKGTTFKHFIDKLTAYLVIFGAP